MKKLFNFISLLLVMGAGLSALTACNEDDTVNYSDYYDWRDSNNAFTLLCDSLQRKDSANTYFNHVVWSLKEPGWMSFYHVVHAADLDSLRSLTPRRDYRPYSTSTVRVHYTLFNSDSVYAKLNNLGKPSRELMRNPGGAIDSIFFAAAYDSPLKADTIESSQVAYFDCTPTGVIAGWGDILQQMYIGDHFVAMIPWYIAYSQTGSGESIHPYSNLFFRIELCDITSWGGTQKQE